MAESGELSPIDPTTGNQFNPSDPSNPQNRFGISVEDVSAYFELSEARARISDEPYRLDVFKELTRNVHPLALGNVQRVYLQIRQLARKLLALHLDEESSAQRIDRIIKALTEEFYSHVHAISRKEAVSLLGEWVRPPNGQEEPAMRALFESYAQALDLRSRFSLPEYMGDDLVRNVTALGAFIESRELSHIFTTELKATQRPNLPPNIQMQLPPGSAPPLPVWAGRAYECHAHRTGWKLNNGEV